MTTSQLALLMKSIAPVFREFVAGALGPFEARLKDLEGRALVPGPAGRDGRDGVDGRDGAKGLDGGIGPEGPIGPAGPPGAMGPIGPAGERGPAGPSGRDAAPVTKAQILEALLEDPTLLDGAVKAYLQAHPPAPGRDGLDGKDGPPGPAGVPGRDGLPGVPGPVGAKGVDGRDGRDGLDGLRPEDIDFVFDAETRGLTLRFTREGQTLATVTKTLPGVQIYRGIWKEGTAYQVGDTVTWGGSQWFCKADTTAKPDEHSRDGVRAWQLCVKRGGEGKAGQKGDAGPQGPKGPAGAPGSGRWP